ncbi:MAG: transposase [Gemmataceae bacterium]
MIALFTEAVHLRNEYHRGHAALEHLENQREVFDDRLRKLASVPRAVPAYQTFANHLMNHFEQWFAFVVEPKIEPTNWKAEQAIRPAVVNRKVWGGNRTAAGAKAQSVLMSVIETARRHTRSVIDHFAETLRNFGNTLVPRPVLLPVRGANKYLQRRLKMPMNLAAGFDEPTKSPFCIGRAGVEQNPVA